MSNPYDSGAKVEQEPSNADEDVSTWIEHIQLYEKEYGAWEKRAEKVVERYADERNTKTNKRRRYNILWSNVQTLKPALYFSPPKPNIERRFKDKDPAGLAASEILERAATYFVRETDFHDNASNAVLDRLLGGRGILWARYVPHFKDATVTENPDDGNEVSDEGDAIGDSVADENEETETDTPPEELEYEEAIADYVHWRDFGHVLARTWNEVSGVWRKVYLTKDELKKRFPDIWDLIPLDHDPHNDDTHEKTYAPSGKKATIYEIWDKNKKCVHWMHKSVPKMLETLEDFLNLKDFYPCPKPLYATLITDSLVPTPDYVQYRDQAAELDELTARISSITKSLRVAGVYDSTAEGLQNLLAEGLENKLVPVKSWALHAEKGGLKSAVEFLPIDMIAKTLQALYEIRDKVKADLNEITGIADIVRGNSDPDETAAAQKIKGKFASLRLSDMQNGVHIFIQETVKIMAEIIAGHFSQKTLAMITGQQLFTNQEKQQIQMQQQIAQQHFQQSQQISQQHAQVQSAPRIPGQPPHPAFGTPAPAPVQPPPQLPPQVQEKLDAPSWDEVMAILQNKAALCFKIDIETDSTIKQDQDEERAAAVDFAKLVGEAVEGMEQITNPALLPLMTEVLMFTVRKFKNARSLEQTFEETIKKLESAPPKPPKPDPAQIKAQSDLQIAQVKTASDEKIAQSKIQSDQLWAQTEAQNDMRDSRAQLQLQQQKLQSDMALEMQKHRDEMQMEMIKFRTEIATRPKITPSGEVG